MCEYNTVAYIQKDKGGNCTKGNIMRMTNFNDNSQTQKNI